MAPPRGESYPLADDLAFDARMRAMTATASSNAGNLKPHQAFVAAYLAPRTPYRGLLLYHGLGTGKTRAAISAAAPHARAGVKVVVMLPASLKRTFAGEMRAAGEDFAVEVIAYNGVSSTWVRSWTDDGAINPLDGAFVIVDEVHNLTRALSGGSDDKSAPSSRKMLYDLVVRAERARVLLLTGSPAVNRPHEVALAVNMVRGLACDHIVRWSRPLSVDEVRTTEATLRECDAVVSARVTATGATVRLTPPGFRTVGSEVARRRGDGAVKSVEASLPAAVSRLIGSRPKSVCRPAFPEDPDAFEAYFVGDAADGVLAAPTVLARRCRGAVSVRDADAGGSAMPRVRHETVHTELSAAQFGEYCRVRVIERRSEGRQGAVGTVHRQYSRSVSNFAFPTADGIRKSYRADADNAAGHEAARATALAALLKHPMWEADAVLERFSPKFVAALRAIDVAPGPVMVYSAFRQLEGAGLFSRALDGRGWRKLTLTRSTGKTGAWRTELAPGEDGSPVYAMPEPNTEDAALLVAMFNGDVAALPPPLRRFDAVRFRAVLLTRSGAEGLSLKNVRQVHILEPHWNGSLSRQVAARAVRLGSHDALPEAEREVRVFTYLSTFSDAQRKSPRFEKIKQRDGGITTDQHLMAVSAAKDARIDRVLAAVRGAAVDCGAYVAGSDAGCYRPPRSEFGRGAREMVPVLLEADAEDGRRVVRDRVVRVAGTLMIVPACDGGHAYDATKWRKGERVRLGVVRKEDGAVRLYAGRK